MKMERNQENQKYTRKKQKNNQKTAQLKISKIVLKQKKGNKTIKDIRIRAIKKLFELENEEEDYYKPVRVSNFYNNNYIEYESKVIKIKQYQSKNTLMKLNHT